MLFIWGGSHRWWDDTFLFDAQSFHAFRFSILAFTNRWQSLYIVLICSSFLLNPNNFQITDVVGPFWSATSTVWEDHASSVSVSSPLSWLFSAYTHSLVRFCSVMHHKLCERKKLFCFHFKMHLFKLVLMLPFHSVFSFIHYFNWNFFLYLSSIFISALFFFTLYWSLYCIDL